MLAKDEALPTVTLGVLAFRDLDATTSQWSGVADYLQAALPDRRVRLLALHLDDLSARAERGELDFILTQPEHYVLLRPRHGLAAIATLTSSAGGRPVNRLGGVIVARAGRQDLDTAADLRGKTIAATHQNALGGYRVQQWTLRQAGIELPDDVRRLEFTGQPQDLVVDAVLAGRVDAGFVRTGLLESLIASGRLAPADIKVVNSRIVPGFPQLLSTDLYPEWPFSALRHVPDDLIKDVTLALLQLAADHPAATRAGIAGFAPPADYTPIESMMLQLRAHPGRLDHMNLRDFRDKYANELAMGLAAALAVLLFVILILHRSRHSLAAALHQRSSLLNCLGEGVYGVDPQGRCTFINPKALEMLGLTQEETIGANPHALFHSRHQDGSSYPVTQCPVSRTLIDGQRRDGEEWFLRKDGTGFPVQFSATPIQTGRRRRGVVVSFRDITEDRKADELIRIAAIAFETQEAIAVTNADSRILRVNQAFTDITGYSAEEVIGKSPSILKSGMHDEHFYAAMWEALREYGHWHGEIWNRRKNGQLFPEWLTISAVTGEFGRITHYVASFVDITQRKEAEEQIQFLALYDPLTHLPNRRLLQERLEKALSACQRRGNHAGLLFIDLDNFKTLNDSMGHDVGDLLLRQVAKRLTDAVRATDTVSRLGGDEFVILLEDLSSDLHEAIGQIEQVGRKMLDDLATPYEFGTLRHHCTASIGAIPFRDQGSTVENLLKAADMAMYKAKAAGRNALCFFDPKMQIEVEQRAVLERELREAVHAGQFVLAYQPQVDLAGRIRGAEALIRWRHPTRGLVAPGEFIGIAEDTRLILEIGQWIIEEACRQLVAWQVDPETAELTIAVNVSPLQFRDERFVDRVAAALAASGAPPSRLKLEITESLLLEDIEHAAGRMDHLKRELGIGLSLDDFGTGYSSLSYLKRLPLDQVKIDRSFVNDIGSNPNDAAITEAIIGLGRTFGFEVLAEGVETADQWKVLIALGCEGYQGYLFGRPEPIANFPLGRPRDKAA
ncbi:MAG: EAL domain-containing protein [Betaproteobacteria bacterium]|nr:EAL domain-containing protein [Betaproteobacteria bacterium]